MGSIRLHPEKGVNPHLTFCPRCHGEARELILVGADDGVYTCRGCERKIIGRPRDGKCPSCKETYHDWVKERTLQDNERLPGELCEACEKETAEHAKIVEAGGIYFKCKDCQAQGVIRPTSELAKQVRAAHQKQGGKDVRKGWFTEPIHLKGNDHVYIACGLEFTKENGCPKCGRQR